MTNFDILARHYREKFERWNDQKEVEKIETPEEIFSNPFLFAEDIANDAFPSVESDKFYSISFIGSQGKGKTFTASLLATKAESKGFLVVYAKAEDILPNKNAWVEEVKEKIRQHGDIDICFVVDDMSYSVGAISDKKQAEFKHFIGDIRHVFEPVLGDIRIFMIYISHRLHSLPPICRNSGSWIFASMLPEDRADAMKLIPKQKEERENLERLYKFLQKIQNEGPKKGKVYYRIGDREFSFQWGKEGNPGDGRLMMVCHAGELRVFQSKLVENMINLEHYRVSQPPKQLPPIPEETLKIQEKQADDFKAKAEQLFQTPKDESTENHVIPSAEQVNQSYESLS